MPLGQECCWLRREMGPLVRWSSWIQLVPGGAAGVRFVEEIAVVLSELSNISQKRNRYE